VKSHEELSLLRELHSAKRDCTMQNAPYLDLTQVMWYSKNAQFREGSGREGKFATVGLGLMTSVLDRERSDTRWQTYPCQFPVSSEWCLAPFLFSIEEGLR